MKGDELIGYVNYTTVATRYMGGYLTEILNLWVNLVYMPYNCRDGDHSSFWWTVGGREQQGGGAPWQGGSQCHL